MPQKQNDVQIFFVTDHGFWLIINQQEFFLDYKNFPWFKNQTLSAIFNVEFSQRTHLFWPDLDVDLDLDSIKNPEKYQLISV